MANPTDKLKRHAAAIAALTRRLPDIAGPMAVRHFKQNFRAQGFVDEDVRKWTPRRTKDRNESRRGKRNILVQTGRLRRSIRVVGKGPNRVTIGTDVPYARIHNEGGTIKATQQVRAHKRRNGSRVKAHKRRVNTTIPQRPFMGDSRKLRRELLQEVDRRIRKIIT